MFKKYCAKFLMLLASASYADANFIVKIYRFNLQNNKFLQQNVESFSNIRILDQFKDNPYSNILTNCDYSCLVDFTDNAGMVSEKYAKVSESSQSLTKLLSQKSLDKSIYIENQESSFNGSSYKGNIKVHYEFLLQGNDNESVHTYEFTKDFHVLNNTDTVVNKIVLNNNLFITTLKLVK